MQMPHTKSQHQNRPWEATASLVCLFGIVVVAVATFRPSALSTIVLLSFVTLGLAFAISALRQKGWRPASLYFLIALYLVILAGMVADSWDRHWRYVFE